VHAEQNNKQANLKMAKNTQANEQTDFRYYDFRPTMQNEYLIEPAKWYFVFRSSRNHLINIYFFVIL